MAGFTVLWRQDPAALLIFLHALFTFYYPIIYGVISFTALYFYAPLGIAMLVRQM